MSASVCLTVVADGAIRQDLFDYLAAQPELVTGFTASDAEGHGPAVHLHSAEEQVKGRADRVLVRLVLDATAAVELVARLRTAFAGAHLVYWTSPVAEFGVIA